MNLKQLLAICNIRHSHNRMRFFSSLVYSFYIFFGCVCVWLMPLFQVPKRVAYPTVYMHEDGGTAKVVYAVSAVRVCLLSSCEYKFRTKEKNTNSVRVRIRDKYAWRKIRRKLLLPKNEMIYWFSFHPAAHYPQP